MYAINHFYNVNDKKIFLSVDWEEEIIKEISDKFLYRFPSGWSFDWKGCQAKLAQEGFTIRAVTAPFGDGWVIYFIHRGAFWADGIETVTQNIQGYILGRESLKKVGVDYSFLRPSEACPKGTMFL